MRSAKTEAASIQTTIRSPFLGRDGLERSLPRLKKIEVANEILNEVVNLSSLENPEKALSAS